MKMTSKFIFNKNLIFVPLLKIISSTTLTFTNLTLYYFEHLEEEILILKMKMRVLKTLHLMLFCRCIVHY